MSSQELHFPFFLCEKGQAKNQWQLPYFCDITIDGVASRFNSKLDIQPKLWDGQAGKAGKNILREATRINPFLLDDKTHPLIPSITNCKGVTIMYRRKGEELIFRA